MKFRPSKKKQSTESDVIRVSPLEPVAPMSKRDVLLIALIGLLSGALSWIVVEAIMRLFELDGGLTTGVQVLGLFIGAFVALLALIRRRVYRPLLIVLAVIISVGGVSTLLAPFSWYVSLGITALLFGLAYTVFGWISRVSSFWICLLVTAVLVVITRVVLQLS